MVYPLKRMILQDLQEVGHIRRLEIGLLYMQSFEEAVLWKDDRFCKIDRI